MDFLDPKKKRNRKIRLNIGHMLVALLVFIGTYILVFQAYGYNVDRNTGEVIQNGLVYIDSAPDGAKIKINGDDQNLTTNTRQALPEGHYTLELSKEGYRNWSRSFDLEGGEVLRYTYPVLFPSTLTPSELQAFGSNIDFSTQSPNRRWIVLAQKNSLAAMTLYDLEQRTDEKPNSTSLNFPASLFTAAAGDHSLKLVEWSTDNRHVLVRHNWTGGEEFIMLDREEPARSYNVNKTLNTIPSKVSLFDKNFEKLFIYNAATKVLSRVDVKANSVETYASNVLSYKSHGDDTVLMAVANDKDPAKADVVMRQGDKSYTIRQIPIDASIPLDIARYDGSWYIAIGTQAEKRTYIYKNPIDLVNSPDDIKSSRAIVLRTSGLIDQVSFSQNARFIMSSSGQEFRVYDAETERHYSYTIPQQLDTAAQKPSWMDGHRIVTSSGGKVLVFDYDGINIQSLVANNPAILPMFDRDYTELYTLGISTASGKYGFYSTQLRLEADK